MRENLVKEKSFTFALRIVRLYKYLTTEGKEYVLSKQILRSGTAIGALVREAEHAESKADFIKCQLLLKKPMKQNIRLSFYFSQLTSTQLVINLFMLILKNSLSS